MQIFKFFLSFLNFFEDIFGNKIEILHKVGYHIYILISLFQNIFHEFLILSLLHLFIA